MKRLALEKEVLLMKFKGLFSNPDELASFLQSFVKGDPSTCPDLQREAEERLKRSEFAFVPDGTLESVNSYKELLWEKAGGQLDLYHQLKEKGFRFGGDAQVHLIFFGLNFNSDMFCQGIV